MKFTSINNGHSCKCHAKADEDYTTSFARRVEYNSVLKDRDFRTLYERGKLPENNSCDELCGIRGLSIEIWNAHSEEHLLKKYQDSHGLAPMLRPKSQIAIFQLTEGAGMVKHTPNQKHGVNIFHYDLYKSDEFSLDKMCLLNVIPLIKSDV